MAKITIQRPLDQPLGNLRLADELYSAFDSDRFKSATILVAFAKIGPLLRLDKIISKWKKSSRKLEVVCGLDHNGTSLEALKYLYKNSDSVYIVHDPYNPFRATFHPKIYLFEGEDKAVAYIGSNNLTVGGTQTNFESFVKIEIYIPEDNDILDSINNSISELKKYSLILTKDILRRIEKTGLAKPEFNTYVKKGERKEISYKSKDAPKFPQITIKAPSALPKDRLGKAKPKRPKAKQTKPKKIVATSHYPLIAHTLVIQIVPHHNGEVFLSKMALNQNPQFFGFPFTGLTTPKKSRNKAYPQRLPDPVVDISVYDKQAVKILEFKYYNLNTVFYDTKAEIRITVPREFVDMVPSYSLMVMGIENAESSLDYKIDVYLDGSSEYERFLSCCNQTMPAGGKSKARVFGWV